MTWPLWNIKPLQTNNFGFVITLIRPLILYGDKCGSAINPQLCGSKLKGIIAGLLKVLVTTREVQWVACCEGMCTISEVHFMYIAVVSSCYNGQNGHIRDNDCVRNTITDYKGHLWATIWFQLLSAITRCLSGRRELTVYRETSI